MGADQSSSRYERSKISKDEMDKLLQQQKQLYEQKLAELLRVAKAQQKNNAAAQETAREEARKAVEKLMKEKQDQLLRQNAQLNNNNPVMTPGPQINTSTTFERTRAPYTCAGSALTNACLSPSASISNQTTQPASVYPNLNNAHAVSSSQFSRGATAGPASGSMSSGSRTMPDISNRSAAYSPMDNNRPVSSMSAQLPTSQVGSRRDNNENSFVFVRRPQSVFVPSRNAPTAPSTSRDRSVSRNRSNVNEDEQLNCPTCKNRFDGHIYQCSQGHSSCHNCRVNARACGTMVSRRAGLCLMPITEMRNITLEAYMSERKVLCPNSDEGCCLYIKLAEMETHVKECPFREMLCPLHFIFGQCSWSGKLSQLAGHFDLNHQMHRGADVDSEMVLLNLKNDNRVVYLVVIGSYNFLFHVKISKQDDKLYMAVVLLGTSQSACKWSYEIHIYNKRQPRRKYQYADICRSGNTSIDELIANTECVAIPLAYANTFVLENILTYKFFIKKDIENNNRCGNNQRGRGGARRRIQNRTRN